MSNDPATQFATEFLKRLDRKLETETEYLTQRPIGETADEVTINYMERVGRIREIREIREEFVSTLNAFFSTNVK